MSLKIEHVRRSFGSIQAVRDVWLEAPEGSIMGIIGPNGAGKTTTMRMILRILAPESGTITWCGKPADVWPLGTFGYLPEERGLYPRMQGRDQLRFFAQLHGLSRKQADHEIEDWTERLSLDEALGKKIEDLSKGNAQKLQFLAAVLHHPNLVILDEPFSGLDPMNARLFKEAVKYLNERGTTILFSSHQMESVEELCNRVCLIAGGRTLVHGLIDDVRQQSGTRILTIKLNNSSGSGHGEENEHHPLVGMAGVELLDTQSPEQWRYSLLPGSDSDVILQRLAKQGRVQHYSIDYPTLEDVYVAQVSHDTQQRADVDMTPREAML